MFMYRVFSCVVGRGCLLWPVHFLGKTLLVFALLHSVFQGPICLLLQLFLDFLLLHPSPLEWKGHLFCVFILKGLVGLHRTVQLQLLQSYYSRLWFFLWSCMDVRVGLWRRLSTEELMLFFLELMLLNCGVGEDSWESLGLHIKLITWLFQGKPIFGDRAKESLLFWRGNTEQWLQALEVGCLVLTVI